MRYDGARLGMDDIWRERNAAQHNPNERRDINPRVYEAFELKTRLGLDQGPHASAQDIITLPHRIKKNAEHEVRRGSSPCKSGTLYS